jgi:outer membrane protein
LSAVALTARAEPAVKILVVDMAKLYDSHYKTQEQNNKLQADKARAEEEVEKMNKEGNALVEEYKNLQEQSSNAALTPEAKSKAQMDAQKKYDEIQAKRNEISSFIQQSSQSLQQRLQTFRSLMLEEISKVATDVAKRRGATILIDKAGPSLIGISNVIYSDPGFDITDDVLKEINKDRPAGAAAPAPAASGAANSAATPSTQSGPSINLPIAPSK